MNVFITGANGYLGGHVMALLRYYGCRPYALNSHWQRLDKNQAGHWRDWIRECDAVVHLAWYSSAGNSCPEVHAKCFYDTMQLIEVCSPYKPFIFASTCSVYGDRGNEVLTEESATEPNCHYTKAKQQAEDAILSHLPNSLVMRLGSLMGVGAPGGRTKKELVVNAFAIDGWHGGKIEMWNRDAWKPLIHVRDAADVILEALFNPTKWKGVYNVAYDCLPASTIAAVAESVTGVTVQDLGEKAPIRSTRVCLDKFRAKVNRASLSPVASAVREFRHFRPSDADVNQPWALRHE